MKGKTLPKKRITHKGKPTQLSIELDIKALVFFLVLVALTASTVFYLGIILGRSMRDPNRVSPPAASAGAVETGTEAVQPTGKLNIYDIKNEAKDIEELKRDSTKALNKADSVLKQAEPAKPESPSASVPEKPAPATEEKPGSFTPTWPDDKTATDTKEVRYTIQIMATRDYEKAVRIVTEMRKKGFNAYLEDITVEENKIHRVRVGRVTKEEIEPLKTKLSKVVGGLDMKMDIYRAE